MWKLWLSEEYLGFLAWSLPCQAILLLQQGPDGTLQDSGRNNFSPIQIKMSKLFAPGFPLLWKEKNMESKQMIPCILFSPAIFCFCDLKHQRDPLGWGRCLYPQSTYVACGRQLGCLSPRTKCPWWWVTKSVSFLDLPGLELGTWLWPCLSPVKSKPKPKATSLNSSVSVSWLEGTRSRKLLPLPTIPADIISGSQHAPSEPGHSFIILGIVFEEAMTIWLKLTRG